MEAGYHPEHRTHGAGRNRFPLESYLKSENARFGPTRAPSKDERDRSSGEKVRLGLASRNDTRTIAEANAEVRVGIGLHLDRDEGEVLDQERNLENLSGADARRGRDRIGTIAG